jgi:hypothetical protein
VFFFRSGINDIPENNAVTSDVNNYNLRNNQNYVPPRCRLRTSASSFIPSTVLLWNKLDMSIRNSPTLSSFKNRVQGDIYKPPKYYNEGPRKLNILLLDDIRIGVVISPWGAVLEIIT